MFEECHQHGGIIVIENIERLLGTHSFSSWHISIWNSVIGIEYKSYHQPEITWRTDMLQLLLTLIPLSLRSVFSTHSPVRSQCCIAMICCCLCIFMNLDDTCTCPIINSRHIKYLIGSHAIPCTTNNG
jgi:hypothetical protein